jgi:hypothetical protein
MTQKRSNKKPSEESMIAFRALVERVQILDVQLVCSTVSTDREFITSPLRLETKISVFIEISCGARLADEDRRLECEVAFNWKGLAEGVEKPVIEVCETYVVSYTLAGEGCVEEKTMQDFAEHNATFNVWPFFRSSLHAITLRLGLPGFALPLFKPMQ